MTIPDQIFRDAIRDAVRDTLRRLTQGEFVDVGGKGMKVKLSTIKRIINERTLCLKH
jgi:hypothetical protein